MIATQTMQAESPMGQTVPPFTRHAISVSLPTWRDTVGYEEGERRVLDAMVTGYPRFFIHLSIQKLAKICEHKFGIPGERAMLFSTRRNTEHCRTFMLAQAARSNTPSPEPIRLVQYSLCPEDAAVASSSAQCVELHIALFPADAFPLAKQFWQHAGVGISSRLADAALALLPEDAPTSPPTSPTSPRPPFKAANRHYAAKSKRAPPSPPMHPGPAAEEDASRVYLEERYGRNLPVSYAPAAKRALRRRIAGVLVRDTFADTPAGPHAGGEDAELGPSSRGVAGVGEDDVFLFPTGMAAIWQAHQLALAARPAAKSVCFGFPYTDTLKILQKWGPGCYFFGQGKDRDIDDLERLLEEASVTDPASPPVLALFTEFPSNPLLRAADLPRLRALADKYDFLVVVDETIGNFVNVEVLPYADIVVSSLSKVFSGDANVMGGSLVLNPQGRHYPALKAHMSATYEDFYFDEDAIYMERNARDFRQRIRRIDENTLAVCELLRTTSRAVKEVFYPKWQTAEHYARCRVAGGGYGGLFSVTFTDMPASRAFFDALPVYKGPSLGTNFTLACPYTVLAHYGEMDWATGFGVEEGLVRVSVGLEEREGLLESFRGALRAAEKAIGI